MEKSLAIVGAGRVGRAFGRLLRELGWKIGVVVTRSEASSRRAVRFIGAGKPHGRLTRQLLLSQVILISTPDDAVSGVARELARMGAEELRGKVDFSVSLRLKLRDGILKSPDEVVKPVFVEICRHSTNLRRRKLSLST